MTLKKKIDLAFVIGFFALLFITFITYRSTEVVAKNFSWMSKTQRVLFNLNRTLTLTVDAETSQRGFAITGMEEFLEPFRNTQRLIDPALDSLDHLIGDSDHRRNLVVLKKLIRRKIAHSEKAINIRRTQSQEAAMALITTSAGRMTMDSIRLVVRIMEENEIARLQDRTGQSLMHTVYSKQNFVLLTTLIASFVVMVYYIIRKNAIRLQQYQEGQKVLIEVLTRQNDQLNDFAQITSHNIRSASGNIAGLVALLKEDSPREEYVMVLERLRITSNNLTQTLNELVDILQVKKEAGIERQQLHFDKVFKKVEESLSAEIIHSNAFIKSNFTLAPLIEYPNVYLESILHNLLSNSLKYQSPERQLVVSVSTEKRNGKIVLRFQDNGLGIDLKKYGDKLFGFRKTFHYHPQAKGVGLFMTKAQVEALGGTISVESEPDKGTTFVIVF